MQPRLRRSTGGSLLSFLFLQAQPDFQPTLSCGNFHSRDQHSFSPNNPWDPWSNMRFCKERGRLASLLHRCPSDRTVLVTRGLSLLGPEASLSEVRLMERTSVGISAQGVGRDELTALRKTQMGSPAHSVGARVWEAPAEGQTPTGSKCGYQRPVCKGKLP